MHVNPKDTLNAGGAICELYLRDVDAGTVPTQRGREKVLIMMRPSHCRGTLIVLS